MPAGNINMVERYKRLKAVKDLSNEGKSDPEIAEETGMAIQTVKRNKKYLEELAVSDLTTEEIGEKRGELYLELIEAAEEAKKMWEKYRDDDKATTAKSFFSAWLRTIEMRARLYGLDNVKLDGFTQIQNAQFNFTEPDKIDAAAGDRLAKILKTSHEEKLRNKHESED